MNHTIVTTASYGTDMHDGHDVIVIRVRGREVGAYSIVMDAEKERQSMQTMLDAVVTAELATVLGLLEEETKMRRALATRSRKAAQILVEAIGAPGPEGVVETATRAAAEINSLREQLRAAVGDRGLAHAPSCDCGRCSAVKGKA